MLIMQRLNAVYRKLSRSMPPQTTVADTALHYRFLDLRRFSGTYKEHFGEYPFETLKRI